MQTEQILGIRFFNGSAEEVVAQMRERGGLLVAPSGTCFERFVQDAAYRRAILAADIVLPDSGFMVSLWRLLKRRKVTRISGLAYLKQLLRAMDGISIVWVLPSEQARQRLTQWGRDSGMEIDQRATYVAPIYGANVADTTLLQLVEARKPRNVIIGIGAGPQEKLGCWLREHSPDRPAIHCVGGALGFLTGDQIRVPDWADRFYLGWFLRLLSQPRVFIPRLWRGRVLPGLLWRYGEELPP